MIQAAQAPATGQAPNQAELARQINAEVRAAIEEARQEMIRAGQQPPPPLPPPTPGEEGTFRIQREDGKVVEVGPGGVKILPGQTAEEVQVMTPQIPPEAVVISIAFFVMIAFILVGWPIARAVARRMDRATVAPLRDAGDQERLARIEHAVEAVAVEVERISENQRFVTKLLAEGRPPQGALPVPGAAQAGEAAEAARVERGAVPRERP